MLKTPKRVGISIDMTPFVDIAFLLLIFFMCTTQFKPPEEEQIHLPESHSEAKSPESEIITIEVSSRPAVYVVWREKGQEVRHQVAPDQVPTEMGMILRSARGANPKARMVVKMDREAPYGIMADMMAALQEAKAPRFNVQTDLAVEGGMFQRAGATK